ncbi:MAG: precorrin-4 C(11)-methyltransferase [Atopobiaceae bacterium]|jgi:precorrin-4/cobalt-precorrin-4 C11-methyltransferase
MVHFVGAGSGAPDLITVRGARLLASADLIIYAGSLVNPQLLDYARPDAEILNSARMNLDEVMEALISAEEQGKESVRLHTGDPSLYGAIREQMDRLAEKNIAFDITPGVSSFSGAAAALRAEYTLPGVSQSVIITRMEGRTAVPEGEKLASLAAHGATMVLFLSAGMVDKVQEELLRGAYTPETPAAIVYRATWPDEQVFHCTVGTLAACAHQHNITRMALICVGNFLEGSYELSKLYDASFSTMYREAKEGR